MPYRNSGKPFTEDVRQNMRAVVNHIDHHWIPRQILDKMRGVGEKVGKTRRVDSVLPGAGLKPDRPRDEQEELVEVFIKPAGGRPLRRVPALQDTTPNPGIGAYFGRTDMSSASLVSAPKSLPMANRCLTY